MRLPGRLRSTTLGDLLGALHRASATGTLELAEDRGPAHRVYLTQGLVAAVDVEDATPSLAEVLRRDRAVDDDVLRRSLLLAMSSRRLHGEVLLNEFRLSPSVVGRALRQQVLARLAVLERLADARISFRVAVRVPRGALGGDAAGAPLDPREFLHGRRRARERSREAAGDGGAREPHGAPWADAAGEGSEPADEESAWHVLGVPPGSESHEIKRAYRRLARTLHPDLHPDATDEERRELQARFVAVTEAYRRVVA